MVLLVDVIQCQLSLLLFVGKGCEFGLTLLLFQVPSGCAGICNNAYRFELYGPSKRGPLDSGGQNDNTAIVNTE